MAARTAPPPRRGVSLAKGPVALAGLAAIALGICGFIFANHSFATNTPHGPVTGGTFLGMMGNGWTWALFAAGGLLLLLGSPAHAGAKTMAFLVALVFGAAAVIGVAKHGNLWGVFAENRWTELVFGAAAVGLLILALLPRVAIGRRRAVAGDGAVAGAPATRERVVEREPAGVGSGRFGRATKRERVVERDPAARD